MTAEKTRKNLHNYKIIQHHNLVTWSSYNYTEDGKYSFKGRRVRRMEKDLPCLCVFRFFNGIVREGAAQCLFFPCELRQMSAGTPASAQPPPPLLAMQARVSGVHPP